MGQSPGLGQEQPLPGKGTGLMGRVVMRQVGEEGGTRYSEEVQLSEQANLSDFITIKNVKHMFQS